MSATEITEAHCVKALAAKADIVLENYKAGTLKRYGLDEASLRRALQG